VSRRRSSDWIRFVTAEAVSRSVSAAPWTLAESKAATNAARSLPESGSARSSFVSGLEANVSQSYWETQGALGTVGA
jgi:hypothetical protein